MTKWTKEEIRFKLETSDQWLYRGLVAIYNYQTEIEKNIMETKEDNGVGFNGVDAFILTKFAQDYIKKGYLSPKQTQLTRKKMLKYSNQLAKIAKPK